jgi:hypothetical protein
VCERPAMIAALQRAFPAALAAWLARADDGTWIDAILWSSREQAEQSVRAIEQLPEAREWIRHIAEPRGLRHVEVRHEVLWGL